MEAKAGLPVTPVCRTKFDYKPIAFPFQDPSVYQRIQHDCKSLKEGCAKFK